MAMTHPLGSPADDGMMIDRLGHNPNKNMDGWSPREVLDALLFMVEHDDYWEPIRVIAKGIAAPYVVRGGWGVDVTVHPLRMPRETLRKLRPLMSATYNATETIRCRQSKGGKWPSFRDLGELGYRKDKGRYYHSIPVWQLIAKKGFHDLLEETWNSHPGFADAGSDDCCDVGSMTQGEWLASRIGGGK